MALFRYFKREKGNLPDPHGPLARSAVDIDCVDQNGCGFNANRARDHEIFSTK